MANRQRNCQIKFRVTEDELDLIERKMAQLGTRNREAYLRKMAIDGLVVKLNMPELKEMISLLRRANNNINQIARRANESGSIYEQDMEDIKGHLDEIWQAANQVLSSLAALD